MVRELKRNLGDNRNYDKLISIFEKILSQRRNSAQKVYSIHEPDVQCISKGKEHKKYEFGNKVSIIRSLTGVILSATSFRNEYDGHTIGQSLKQVRRLTGTSIKKLAADRGYREINGTQILIPDTPKSKDSYYQRKKKHWLFCKRADIEPTIGHLKSDHLLGHNFYKETLRGRYQCKVSRCCIQLQKSHDGSWSPNKKSPKHLPQIGFR